MQSLRNNSRSVINAFDLIGKQITAADIIKTEELVKMNYGVDYPKEKFTMLWEMIKEEGWTDHRLQQTVKYFLKNKKYPNWTIADWFDFGVKLYSNSEYLKKLHEVGRTLNDEIEWYVVDKVYLWKYKDGVELPFEKAVFKKQV